MNFLVELLSFISSGILILCVALLLILLLQSLISVGHFGFYYRGAMQALDQLSLWIHSDDTSPPPIATKNNAAFAHCLAQLLKTDHPAKANHLIAEYESDCECRLNRLNRMAKLGPLLGLIGTLVPMGPALEGLAKGDIVQLASQMQVAFTTTVIGLVIGGIGFMLYQLERRLVTRQLAALDCSLHREVPL